jgi:uncharacterized protein
MTNFMYSLIPHHSALRILVLSFCLLIAGGSAVSAYQSPGTPQGYVNDFAGVITDDVQADLARQLEEFEKKTSHEIAVVTIPSLGGDDIESYATTLFREWGIGKKGSDNGVLFLAAIEDRKARIEVGYGLEGALTDLESQYIQRDHAIPFFRQGNFSGGILNASVKIMEAVEGEIVPTGARQKTSLTMTASLMEFFILGGIFIFSWLASLFARTKSWWLGGVVGGVIGGVIALITAAWFWILLAAILGLLFDYVVSKNYRAHPDHPAWWAGGAWHGWDRWGGGGPPSGGWGGGSSGGGGSSSSW